MRPPFGFVQYQREAMKTAVFPAKLGVSYTTLGLVGEAGEVAEKIKKLLRLGVDPAKFLVLPESDRLELVKELGDVLWYLAVLSEQLGWSFDDVARINLEKLKDRQNRDVLKSQGDNR